VFIGNRHHLEIDYEWPDLSENTARTPFWHTLKGLRQSLRLPVKVETS
jgi:hypothetical protein